MDERVTFGPFELDVATARLLKRGTVLKIAGQPLQVLAMLLERPGAVVTREELRARLWGNDTFVDFEHGLNAAVNKLRFALGDAVGRPRYIETIPRRGYRFVAPVERTSRLAGLQPDAAPAAGAASAPPPDVRRVSAVHWMLAGAVAVVLFWLPWGIGSSLSSTNVSTGRTMLVVLPFENLSGDRDQEYFSEGLTDEMITALGQLAPHRLGVIARTSASYYKDKRFTVRRIAAELGVQYVIEGSVRRAGDRVRVNAKLIHAGDDTHVWSEIYDRDVRDLLAVQNELARAVAQQIRLALPLPGEQARSPAPEAYEAYLRGRHLLRRRTADALAKGHAYMEEAVRRDPGFALGYAGLSEAYQRLAYRTVSPRDAMPRALDAAQRSLALDPDLAEAHAALALIRSTYEFDWMQAGRDFRRALELNTSSVDARVAHAAYLSHIGRFDEAIAEATQALQLDPVSLAASAQLAVVLYRARRYDEALQQLQATAELDPNYPLVHLNRGLVHAARGRYADAIAAFEAGLALDPESSDLMALLGYALGRSGVRERAREILVRLEGLSTGTFVQPYTIGLVHLGLGDRPAAIERLERGYQERSWMTALLKVNPELDELRRDPRFQALVLRVRFPGE